MHVKCKGVPQCNWKLHTLKATDEDAYVVREYYPIHTCNKAGKITNIKSSWLAKKYLSSFACDPRRSVKGLRREIKRDTGLNVSRQVVYRMKNMAFRLLYGTEEEQMGLLPDYKEEVLTKNPSTTFLLDVNDETGKFERLYVCIAACKAGFKECRKILGVDGCHLSGEFGGVLLTAVGVDPNNNTYPITWAVVQSETYDSWAWFLSILESDLEMQEHSEWTWMSDKLKGLIKAFEKHFKESANRFCVKHLHGNMKTAGFTGTATKEALWNLATATTMAQYTRRLDELETLNPGAAAWLHDKSESDYCRAFFKTDSKCDILLNNGCETFNSTILDARELGIIWMCEWLMIYVMSRFQKNRDMCAKNWKGKICPRIRKLVDRNIQERVGCETLMADKYNWSVEVLTTGDKYAVDLKNKTCGCRRWDLTGIPCRHALCYILENEWDPEDFVHEFYFVETYKKVYQYIVYPINGKSEWNQTGLPKPLPPNEGRSAGRPERARKRKSDELAAKTRKCRGGGPMAISKTSQFKLKKTQISCTCKYCGIQGHNTKGCPIRKANAAEETFSFNKAAAQEGTAPEKGCGKQVLGKHTPMEGVQPTTERETAGTSKVAGKATSFPSIAAQMKEQGVLQKNHSKTLNVDGATVHMRSTPANVITPGTLETIKEKKKAKRSKK